MHISRDLAGRDMWTHAVRSSSCPKVALTRLAPTTSHSQPVKHYKSTGSPAFRQERERSWKQRSPHIHSRLDGSPSKKQLDTNDRAAMLISRGSARGG